MVMMEIHSPHSLRRASQFLVVLDRLVVVFFPNRFRYSNYFVNWCQYYLHYTLTNKPNHRKYINHLQEWHVLIERLDFCSNVRKNWKGRNPYYLARVSVFQVIFLRIRSHGMKITMKFSPPFWVRKILLVMFFPAT